MLERENSNTRKGANRYIRIFQSRVVYFISFFQLSNLAGSSTKLLLIFLEGVRTAIMDMSFASFGGRVLRCPIEEMSEGEKKRLGND